LERLVTDEIDLADFAARRDYRLRFVWKCWCGKDTKIMMHRTTDEYEAAESFIKQVCTEGHITRPDKFCSKCFTHFTQSQSKICPPCEERVRLKSYHEVSIEEAGKSKQRAKHWLKKGKIGQEEFDNMIQSGDLIIEESTKTLEEIQQKDIRKI